MAHDPVARNLRRSAPVADNVFLDAIARLESLSLADLQRAADGAHADFRAWAEDPANSKRAFIESPAYVNRIAAESLLERRLFTE